MNEIQNILIVCTGNSCRSVLAEALLKHMLSKEGLDIHVHSAGTGAQTGKKACEIMLKILSKEGLEGTAHRTRKINRAMIDEADILLVMEEAHRRFILKQAPGAKSKILLLSAFYPGPSRFPVEADIPDPIGMSDFFYENVGEMIRLCCQNFTNQLKKETAAFAQLRDLRSKEVAASPANAGMNGLHNIFRRVLLH